MLYSTLIVAASAFAGFASAQNASSQFQTPIPCCSVDAGSVPMNDKQTWCTANQNTCVELCGGQGKLASNGNSCSAQSLEYSCDCRNGTSMTDVMSKYQQTVPGQMCRVWYDQCITASGSDDAAQFQCIQARDNLCGNLTTTDATNAGNGNSGGSSASASASSKPSSTGGSSSGASPTPSASTAPAGNAAATLAQYGTPALAGGLLAIFGFVL
ncbi:hypothetical protein PtrSN002B_000278 [Pyrenophora tritici-repentis]|uniref:DUF3729 domain containing protein n=2 Tax=Pyrenophora tritici-repentis TaxID=45151 RepID=A0A2W1GNK5_9PLEO|nr:uncharacterized protein PTRG_02796 [Pyrenophora tritici-repentis Pt-1C-BFP]KAA8623132.1 hypothetical protein PtrV1_04438 [Pyrenophora tritici-repentis]EDU45319.1 conserved hypothetical protein [Pyrenophora tritici-repentis Pt-1C-BFP]KAF7452128.1 hypothetical protein A1F99_039050 [Pyrenophora tritici-repentis]KAF7574756.1 DUF3729 domain containing protein [Pyrenophora tritici-repentis]KAG9386474.1 hypothetical protein A1F94_003224 [Pyrenophora tritici-repentis]